VQASDVDSYCKVGANHEVAEIEPVTKQVLRGWLENFREIEKASMESPLRRAVYLLRTGYRGLAGGRALRATATNEFRFSLL
jgi:hypothetical protein